MKGIDQVTSFTLKSPFYDFKIYITPEIVDHIPYQLPKEVFKVIQTNLDFEFAECDFPYSDVCRYYHWCKLL